MPNTQCLTNPHMENSSTLWNDHTKGWMVGQSGSLGDRVGQPSIAPVPLFKLGGAFNCKS